MASLHTSIIWIVYAILVTVLIGIASIFIYVYQTPRDRSPSVTITCIFAITTLLATVMLLPADVALVSSTSLPKLGRRKDWATQDEVDTITFSLTIVYYFLYSLDAFLCLILIPFTYFWYEEYDELGEQSTGQRFWNALKYTLCFIAIVSVLFLVGFFAPVSKNRDDVDLDYFRRLLLENHGERALTFALGLLITIGVCIYVLYTSSGLALLPVKLIKTAPSLSNPTVKSTTAVQLESNRERQRQLEGRCGGDFGALSSKDRRELEVLVRKERTLIRQQRLAEESQGNGRGWLMKAWYRLEAIFRPVKLLGGIVLLLLGLTTWTSMLLTGIDKATNSICKHRCGYILGHINVFNPLNWVLVESAKIFPMDYAIFTVLVLLFFCGSVVGIAAIGIRFLWIRIFQIRKGHTSPQALLVATVMMVLIILALNYSISMLAAPQYATFGPQTFCDRPNFLGWQPNCSSHEDLVKPCSELANNPAAKSVCTPSVASTFFNRVTLNFPFFGDVIFWAQFVFLGVYIITTVTSLIRTPKLDERQIDEDGEEEEEEGLLASTGRRFNANWQDITGRSDRQ